MQYLIPYHRCYNNPHPQRRVVLDHVSDFISSVSKSLKCGTIRASKFSIEFRLDVFRYLFNSKGRARGSGKLYEKDDFNSDYFGEDWWFVLDKNGDGCCVDFPMEMRTAVKFSPIMYSKCSDGRIVERLRSYSEIVYVILLKRRC